MKKIYLLSAVAIMGLASCDDFDDQFHIGNQIGDIKKVEMELSDADYSTIANLAANKQLAAQLDAEAGNGSTAYTDALAKLGSQKYFGTMITADQFLPALIQNKYPEADLGSSFKITYNEYCGKSQYLTDFGKLKEEYTLTADDYATAWDGASTATYLTPATVGKLPSVLKAANANAAEGDIIVVNYAYSDFEPAGGGSTPETKYDKISDVTANTDGGEYTVKGYVCAKYSRGFLLTDNTGYILVYQSSDVNLGDEVVVQGTTTQYGGLMQFPLKDTELSVTVSKTGNGTYAQPNPNEMAGEDFDSYADAPYVAYVKYNGKLTINGNYYNIAVAGTEKVASLSYVPEGLVDASLDGKDVTVYGYLIGTASKGKYVNTMAVNVIETPSGAKARKVMRAASAKANKSAVYRYDGSAWKVYTTDEATVMAAPAQWYDMIGSTTVAKPNNYFPTLLQQTYPFAEDGQKVGVAYRKSSSAMAIAEYTFTAGEGWAASKEYKKETTNYSKTENGIEALISTYLNETLLGNEGGFVAYNVNLNTLNYVWSNTTNYGWKASAYANSTNVESESWLVSPALNMKKGKNPEMVFEEAMNFLGTNNIDDFLSVKVSTNFDGNDVTAATWETLTLSNRSDGQSWTFSQIAPVSLAQFVGNTIHIAFVYKSTNSVAPTYEFKNIVVREKEDAE